MADESQKGQSGPPPVPAGIERRDTAIAGALAAQDNRAQRAAWLGNIRINQSEIARGRDIRVLHDVFWDIPGVVIGAGPSLEKNVGLLRENHQRYGLFCCDRAFKRVVENTGVIPPITVVTDMSPAVAGFFSGADTSKTILVAPTYVAKEVLALKWREKIFYNVEDFDKGYESAAANLSGKRITVIPGGVIVGNMAFLVAKIAGCNPITFIGSDLSMTEPSKNPGEVTYSHEDEDGNKVYSLAGFLAGFEWINKFLRFDKDAAAGILKVYNSTEGGIMYSNEIKGIPFKEFMERHLGSEKSLKTMLAKKLGK